MDLSTIITLGKYVDQKNFLEETKKLIGDGERNLCESELKELNEYNECNFTRQGIIINDSIDYNILSDELCKKLENFRKKLLEKFGINIKPIKYLAFLFLIKRLTYKEISEKIFNEYGINYNRSQISKDFNSKFNIPSKDSEAVKKYVRKIQEKSSDLLMGH